MTTRWPGTRAAMLLATLLALALPSPAPAQDDAPTRPVDRPAFSLASGEIFTTQASPFVTLTFERLGSLDFRIYRVADPIAFFEGLDEPHALGSEEYTVPTEQTWLERLASWKAERRADVQGFLRRQTSRDYRAQRRAGADKQTIQRRVQLGLQAYAQVPLLNDKQIVASWREMLPRLADGDAPPEMRARFERYLQSLLEHEDGHVRYAWNHRADVAAAINRAGCTGAARAAQRATDAIAAHDIAYDKATDHGATTIVPF